jgi:hypothetical protein
MEMEVRMSFFSYLWNGTVTGWTVSMLEYGDGRIDYQPYNERTNRLLIIEDVELKNMINRKMLDMGVNIVRWIQGKVPVTE